MAEKRVERRKTPTRRKGEQIAASLRTFRTLGLQAVAVVSTLLVAGIGAAVLVITAWQGLLKELVKGLLP